MQVKGLTSAKVVTASTWDSLGVHVFRDARVVQSEFESSPRSTTNVHAPTRSTGAVA
jgi:hypothetical protein